MIHPEYEEYYEKSNDEIVTVYDRYEGLKDGATFALRRIGSIIGQGGNDYLVLEEVKSTINKLLKELWKETQELWRILTRMVIIPLRNDKNEELADARLEIAKLKYTV